MSCYEWESGTIVIPKAQYSKFFKDFLKGYNELREKELLTMKRFQKEILAAGKGKRNFNFRNAADDMLYRGNNDYTYDMLWKLFKDDVKKPKTPTRKMVNFANTKTRRFDVSDSEAGIYFDKERHMVGWDVPENNHACDSAHQSPDGKLFFRLLNRIEWKRNSGGEIVGNDEYNRDDCFAGGATYIKMTFGKK